ncbi:MAG TPA: hypothetical protein VJ983_01025 [candidate division Zixibacteria bacterium]|nr:hypothetical protein [candidate division Zixibacteria bacterium]
MKIGRLIIKWAVPVMCVLGLSSIPAAAIGQGASGDSLSHSTSISTPEAAVAAADRLSGFDKLYANEKPASSSVTARSVMYRDSTTPFIHGDLDNKSAWKVSYSEFDLAGAFGVEKSTESKKTAVVWIDSLSGQVLRMDINKVGTIDSTMVFRMPTPEEAEPQIGVTWHSYIGLPKTHPKVPLLDALKPFEREVFNSYNTVVQYLMVKKGNDTFPAWVVYARGIHFYPPNGDSQAERAAASQGFLIVNAETGRCVRRDSGPAPYFPWPNKR